MNRHNNVTLFLTHSLSNDVTIFRILLFPTPPELLFTRDNRTVAHGLETTGHVGNSTSSHFVGTIYLRLSVNKEESTVEFVSEPAMNETGSLAFGRGGPVVDLL